MLVAAQMVRRPNWEWLPCRVVPFDGLGKGTVVGPSPAQCTTNAATKPIGIRSHYLDIGIQASALIAGSNDIDSQSVSPGVAFRATLRDE